MMKSVGTAVAHVDGLAEQGHRLVGLARRVGGRHARAGPAGQARQHGVTAGGLEPVPRVPGRKGVPDRQRAARIGRGAVEVAEAESGQAAAAEALPGSTDTSGPSDSPVASELPTARAWV